MGNFYQILEYLQGSVQICTESHRKFFLKLQIRVVFFRRAFFNQLISFSKTEFMTSIFEQSLNICQDLCRSVQIHRECSTWEGYTTWHSQIFATFCNKSCIFSQTVVDTEMPGRNIVPLILLANF